MKKVWVFSSLVAIVIACSFVFVGCSKNDIIVYQHADTSTAKQNILLYMGNNGATNYDSVIVAIKSVSILVDTFDKGSTLGGYYTPSDSSSSVWINLNVNAGQYNLLAFQNGLDTLLASGSNIPPGKVKVIKIGIGTNNYFVKSGTTYPLQIFGTDSTIATINLRGNEFDTYAANSLRLWLAFNINNSIVTYHNGFYLNPVLGYFILSSTGSVSGTVLSYNAASVISIYNNADTAYALPNRNGSFLVRGLNVGTYSIFVNASNGYKDTTINNVTVTNGNITSIGTITLHQ